MQMQSRIVVVIALAVGFACAPSALAQEPGLQDRDDIYMQTSFESGDWRDAWTDLEDTQRMEIITGEDAFQGDRHLRMSVHEGEHISGDLSYYFADETGSEPEAVYFRYALLLRG